MAAIQYIFYIIFIQINVCSGMPAFSSCVLSTVKIKVPLTTLIGQTENGLADANIYINTNYNIYNNNSNTGNQIMLVAVLWIILTGF